MAGARIRVIDLETGGNGPNDVCEIGWQDVIMGECGKWEVVEERGALFVNPGRPISPDTMAIHHILDSQVADAPYWKDIASTVLRPPGRINALAAHRAAFEQRYCTPGLQVERPGFAHGSARFVSGHDFPGSPTRCCVINECPPGWCTKSDCRPIERCPTPMLRLIICETC
ncbi:3'-5' exonuclease [Agrobacterium rosae]|uniref:3'-5' exonuclease n=1 Tax=Agrobacterium rosae TaxID=1972867 RepID=UPI001FCD72AB|nr:3'-5' exonuclease [Agrobacterium rosae]